MPSEGRGVLVARRRPDVESSLMNTGHTAAPVNITAGRRGKARTDFQRAGRRAGDARHSYRRPHRAFAAVAGTARMVDFDARFHPGALFRLASQLPGGDTAAVTSFVTHMAVHADIAHLGFNSAWLLAFGSVLCARLGNFRFFAFSILGGMSGALLFLAFNPGLAAPVIGAAAPSPR